MAAGMIPIVLVICLVFLGAISGWAPFTGLPGLVVLGLFGFVVGGLVMLLRKLEAAPTPRH